MFCWDLFLGDGRSDRGVVHLPRVTGNWTGGGGACGTNGSDLVYKWSPGTIIQKGHPFFSQKLGRPRIGKPAKCCRTPPYLDGKPALASKHLLNQPLGQTRRVLETFATNSDMIRALTSSKPPFLAGYVRFPALVHGKISSVTRCSFTVSIFHEPIDRLGTLIAKSFLGVAGVSSFKKKPTTFRRKKNGPQTVVFVGWKFKWHEDWWFLERHDMIHIQLFLVMEEIWALTPSVSINYCRWFWTYITSHVYKYIYI